MSHLIIDGKKYIILSTHDAWAYLEDEDGKCVFASKNGEPPEDAPVTILMRKFEESKN